MLHGVHITAVSRVTADALARDDRCSADNDFELRRLREAVMYQFRN